MVRVPTRTETFVHAVCKQSFLSLWSYPSPQGRRPDKELCDILVLCQPDIIIFSVKEVRPKANAPDELRYARWVRAAVDKSVAQVYGAERFIQSDKHPHVVQEDGSEGLPYPAKSARRIHRVAVALGGDDHFPVSFGDFGKGFVHVFDERSFRVLMSELDTITDFVEYLQAKEELFSTRSDVLFGLEEDILAVYLHGNRTFPAADRLLIEDGSWERFLQRPEFQAKKVADRQSYVWDRVIERIGKDVAARNMLFDNSLGKDESVLRVMARENRFNRRILGRALLSFFEASTANQVRSRMTLSPSNVGYVFLAAPRNKARERRTEELGMRCFVARIRMTECNTVIGLGTEQKTDEPGASWDLHLLRLPELTAEYTEHAEQISEAFGYFAAPRTTAFHEDEYPGNCPSGSSFEP